MKQKILNIQELYRWGVLELKNAGILEAELDAWYLLEYVTGISKAIYYADPRREISLEQEEQYRACIQERSQRIPLQHITGEQEFMGLSFYVNEHVLVPRQDTETLVEEALKVVKDGDRVLDMCTGSGCILLSLLKLTKASDIAGVGVDVSGDALEVAKRNAKSILDIEKFPGNIEFIQSDLFQEVPEDQKFDLIISNPPYIPTKVIEGLEDEVKLHDPWIALDGKEDGLHFYKEIIKESTKYISPEGWLMFEIGHDQGEAVKKLMEESGYTKILVKKDLAALDRVVIGMYNEE